MRTNVIPWILLIITWFVLSFRKSFLKPTLVFIGGTAAIIIPIIMRNHAVSGNYELMTKGIQTINFVQNTGVRAGYIPSDNDYRHILKWTGKIFDGRADNTLRWILDEPFAYIKFLQEKFINLIDTSASGMSLWLVFSLFIAASIIFLIKPKLFSETSRRKDYLITGGFVWVQLFALLIFGKSEVRHLAPIAPFTIIFSVALILPAKKLVAKLLRRPPA